MTTEQDRIALGDPRLNQPEGGEKDRKKLWPVVKWGEFIGPAECPMMRRWLIQNRWGTVRLHHFMRSDPQDLHDHPWSFITLMLRGSYEDHALLDGKPVVDRLRPGSIRYRKAEHRHRVVTVEGSWTFVITTAWQRHWGFWGEHGFERWKNYLTRVGYAACED